MTPMATVMRINPAAWLALPTILLLTLQLGGSTYNSDRYGVSLTAHATSSVFLIAPLAAFCGAWQGSRFQRSGWNRYDWSRGVLQIVGSSLLPTLLIFGGILVAWTFFSVAPQLPHMPVLSVSVLVVLAWSCAGFSLGFLVRPAVALPLSLLFTYCWMVLPLAVEPLWLRHLNGAWFSCCSTDQTIAPSALLGATSLSLGIATSAILVVSRRDVLGWRVLNSAPALISFALAAVLVQGLGADPAAPRRGDLVCTVAASSPRVCLWPEHRHQLGLVSAVAPELVGAWRGVGLSVPDLLTEDAGHHDAALHFTISTDSSREDVIMALASALVPSDQPQCSLHTDWPGGRSYPYLLAYSADAGGMSSDGLAARFSPEVLGVVDDVRGEAVEAQHAWFSTNLKSLTDCRLPPTGDIL